MIRLLTLLLFSLVYTVSMGQQSQQADLPRFVESTDPPVKVPDGQEYTFGYLEVPENRAVTDSRIIRLPVYIFKSRGATPAPDPIIYTVGGPGGSTMLNAPYMNYYQYLDERDFILFEQRGTAYAQPHLACPEWSVAQYTAGLPGTSAVSRDSLLEQAARECRDRLESMGADLDGYRTREITADIADLRKVLGFDEYNLLTISYSTKIAQVLMRDFPEGIRSVVMDSPLPLEVSYDEESVSNLLETIRTLFADCADSPACNKRFPDLENTFFDYLREITEQPLEVEVLNPENNQLETFRLTGSDLVSVFTEANTENVASIPLEMEKILNGDLSSVKEGLASLFTSQGEGTGMGARLSVWCAEEYPFVSPEEVLREKKSYPEVRGLSPVVFEPGICEIWGVAPETEMENIAIKSDIPVLLISGEYDSDTPVKWAEAMQENLSKSYHLIFPGWKHVPTTYWANPCGMTAANAFFHNPDRMPAPACLSELQEVEFLLAPVEGGKE